jgi:hypothetical protein
MRFGPFSPPRCRIIGRSWGWGCCDRRCSRHALRSPFTKRFSWLHRGPLRSFWHRRGCSLLLLAFLLAIEPCSTAYFCLSSSPQYIPTPY